jgi:plastocyanin
MKRLLFLASLTLGAMLIFGSVAGAQKASVAGAQKQQKQATRTVVIQGFSFKPAHITVKRGTRVTWINKDMTKHTATASNGAFDSGVLRSGQSYSHTFKTAGRTNKYHCEIHHSMRGSVTVKR